MELGDILPETGETYGVSVFVLLERNTDDIAILPGLIVFCLYTAGEVDGFVLARQHGLHGVEISGTVVGMHNTFKFLERDKSVGGIVVNRVIVGLEFLRCHIEVPMYDIAHLHGKFTFGSQVLCFLLHLYFLRHIQLGADNQQLSSMFGRQAHTAFVMAVLSFFLIIKAQGGVHLFGFLVYQLGEKLH